MAVATPAPQRAAARKKLAKAGKALSDGSYPIPDTAYLKKAIRAVGRAGPGKRPALAALIRKRAKALGAAGQAVLKGSWADNKQSATAMANSLRGQLIELGFTPDKADVEVHATMPFMVRELASVPSKTTDGIDAFSKSGSSVANMHPKRKAVLKKLIKKKVNPNLAYKMAQKVKVG